LFLEVKFLVLEEKVTESNSPSDFDEQKSYVKTLANTLAMK